jgi:hypothetical protein
MGISFDPLIAGEDDMLRVLVATALLIASVASGSTAAIRHDRACDKFQDNPPNLNPEGGNAIMFGVCGELQDLPVGQLASRHHWWNAYSCGYQAYRENKRRGQNPYLNEELKTWWAKGWDVALEACEEGKLPFGQ